MNLFKSKHWFGFRWEPREEDRNKPEKGLFWRKQENASKHGARSRGWGATESDGDASQIRTPCRTTWLVR